MVVVYVYVACIYKLYIIFENYSFYCMLFQKCGLRIYSLWGFFVLVILLILVAQCREFEFLSKIV